MKQLSKTTRVILMILLIATVYYIALMIIWNKTSPNHKPTNALWNWKKEGYHENPIYDRYKPEKN